MRVTTTMLSLFLVIIWTINVWAADDKKKVKEKKVWVQTTEKKAGLGVMVSNIDEDGDILIDVFRTPEHDKDFRVIRSSGINATTGGKGGYLGVQVKDLSDQLQEYFEVKNGVLVEEVMKDSPAEKAGLKAGDVIVSINDRKLEDYHDLIRTVNFYNPEEKVTVSYVRKGDTEETKVVLGKKPAYHWKTKKMKGPQNLQIISKDVENKVLITEESDRKIIRINENDANFNIKVEKEFFIL